MMKIGDRVYDEVDPRHVGRIVKIDTFSGLVEVRWIERGSVSYLRLERLRPVSRKSKIVPFQPARKRAL
jgi:hypothetical protein